MESKDITRERIIEYLDDYGVTEAMVFEYGKDRLDPIDRHVILRDLYESFTEFRMGRNGLNYINSNLTLVLNHSKMKGFESIQTLDDCVSNMKSLCRVKELQLSKNRKELNWINSPNKDHER